MSSLYKNDAHTAESRTKFLTFCNADENEREKKKKHKKIDYQTTETITPHL